MLVSFIIVAYNAEKVIEASLDCLKKQTYPHDKIEVILVNSASKDNTKQVLQKFKENTQGFNRIVILENEKKILPCG